MMSVKMFSLCIFVVFCLLNVCFGNITYHCQTPDLKDGLCIHIKDCPLIMTKLQEKPLTEEVKTNLRHYLCVTAARKMPKVCCPQEKLIIQNEEQSESIKHKNSFLINPINCGINTNDKIIRGIEVQAFDYPWNALLIYNTTKGQQILCGGSLINDNYILTSAHCVKELHENNPLWQVRLGENDLSTEIDCTDIFPGDCAPAYQDIEISEIIPHPNYSSITLENNIGLIRLKTFGIYDGSVLPICLPTTPDKLLKKYSYSGWGLNHFGEESSKKLRNIFNLVPEQECQKNYTNIEPEIKIGQNQVCLNSNKGKCIGERGDPITTEQSNMDYRLAVVGIMSHGSLLCNNADLPKVFTRVFPYMEWILDNLKP